MALEYGINFNTEKGLKQAETEIKKWRKEFKGYFKDNPLDINIDIKGGKGGSKGGTAQLQGYRKELQELRNAYKALTVEELKGGSGQKLIDKYNKLKKEVGLYGGTLDQSAKALSRLKAETEKTIPATERQTKAFRKQSGALQDLRTYAMNFLSVYAGIRMIKNLADITGEFEMQAVSMKAILMDAERGAAIFERIKDLAVISPFQFKDLVTYTKQLSAFSVPYENLYDTTKMLADLSAGLGVGMDRLILAFGQVRAASVLRGQELRQFTEAGIPIVEELRKKFEELNGEAVTAGQVFEFISERKVPFEMVKDIIVELTSEGGKFYKMQEKQAETLKGKISNLKDAADIAMASIGESDGGILKGTVDGVRLAIENYELLGKAILTVATVAGIYKAAIKLNTIATTANIAAQRFSIASKNLNTAATIRNIAATKAATVAQGALNAVMAVNPYVLIAMALTALVGVVWALSDGLTEAERLQKKLNEQMKEAAEKAEKERGEIRKLIDTINDEVSTRRQKQKAIDSLQAQYPAIFANMDMEAIKHMDSAKAIAKYNEEAEKKRDLDREGRIAEIDKEISFEEEGLLNSKSLYGAKLAQDRIDSLNRERAILSKSIRDDKALSAKADFEALDLQEKINLKQKENIALLSKAESIKNEGRKDSGVWGQKTGVDEFNTELELDAIEKRILLNKKDIAQFQSELNKPNRTMVEALKDLDKWQKILIENQEKLAGGSEDQESVLEAEERIGKIKSELALMGWEDPSKKKGGGKKEADDTLKKYLENVTAKVNEYKERFNIYKALTEKGGETDMDFEFTFNGEPNLAEFIKKQMKAIGGESLNLAIDFKTAKFEDLNLGDNLKEEEVAKLKSLFDELRKMSLTEFQDMDKLLSKYASYTKRRAELDRNYVKEKKELFDANADSSEVAEQLRVYREESDKLVMEFAKKDEAFNSFVTSIATQSVDRLRFMLMQLQAELVQSKVQGMDAESLVVLKAKIAALEEELKTASKDVNQTKDVEDSYKSWKRLQSVLTKINRTFDEIGDGVGGLAGEIISTAGDISTSTLQMVSGITMLAKWSVQATKMTAEGASKAIQTVEKASVILAIVGAALQILTKISSFFIKDTQIDPKVIEQYNSLISVTNEAIDAHKELLETLSGSDAKRQVLESIKLIELQIDATRRMGKAWLNSGASGGFLGIGSSASEGVKVMKNLSSYRKQLASIGVDYDKLGKRGEGLLDLTAEQVKLMKEKAPEAWAALGKEVQDYLENIEEASKGLKDLMDAEKEALTGLSFDDLTSGLDEFLLSADSGFEAISESFEDYMVGAILRVVKNNYLNSAMEDWYADFAEAMDDGELTEAERTALEKSYREKLEEGKRQLDAAKELAGIESDVSTNLKGISKGVGAMTEDTALVLGSYLDSIRFRLFEYLDYMQSPEQAGTMALMAQSQNQMIFHLASIEANTKVTADTNTELLTNLNKVISVDGTRGSFGITVNT